MARASPVASSLLAKRYPVPVRTGPAASPRSGAGSQSRSRKSQKRTTMKMRRRRSRLPSGGPTGLDPPLLMNLSTTGAPLTAPVLARLLNRTRLGRLMGLAMSSREGQEALEGPGRVLHLLSKQKRGRKRFQKTLTPPVLKVCISPQHDALCPTNGQQTTSSKMLCEGTCNGHHGQR